MRKNFKFISIILIINYYSSFNKSLHFRSLTNQIKDSNSSTSLFFLHGIYVKSLSYTNISNFSCQIWFNFNQWNRCLHCDKNENHHNVPIQFYNIQPACAFKFSETNRWIPQSSISTIQFKRLFVNFTRMFVFWIYKIAQNFQTKILMVDTMVCHIKDQTKLQQCPVFQVSLVTEIL